MITGSEAEVIWIVIGKLGVGVGTVVALIKGLQFLIKQMPVSKLEVKVQRNTENIQKNTEHIKTLDLKIKAFDDKIEETDEKIRHIDEGVKRIGESQISLLHHFVSGDGQHDMAKEAEKLTEYFIKGGYPDGNK